MTEPAVDPRKVFLGRAARVAVVATPLFALFQAVLHMPNAAGGAVFAVVGLGSIADFWGRPARRAGRYLATGTAGLGLLVLGGLVAPHLLLALAATAAVSFATVFIGVLGGPFYLARFPLVLAFLLAVTSPSSSTAAAERALGWAVGTACIALAALVLWPIRIRYPIRMLSSVACRELAEVVRAKWIHDQDGPQDRLRATIGRLRTQSCEAHLTPGAVAPDERALSQVVHDIERVAAFTMVSEHFETDDNEQQLAEAIASCLDRVAATMPEGPGEDLAEAIRVEDLTNAYSQYFQIDEQELSAFTGSPKAAQEVIRQTKTSAIRGGARQCIALGRLARAWNLGSDTTEIDAEDRGSATPLAAIRSNLGTRSLWFRDAFRTSVALVAAIALVNAGAGGKHGFWVALGTFSVLRMDLATTSRSVSSTIIGNLAGFVVSSAAILLAGDHVWVLWVVLPVSLFLMSWTGRFPPAVGAASFTFGLIIMFSIIAPAGLSTGKERVLDVVIGAAISVAVTLIVWPRIGAGPARQLADIVDLSASHLGAAVDRWSTSPDPIIAEPPAGPPFGVMAELDRVLDTLAGSAPSALPGTTRTLLVAAIDIPVATAIILEGDAELLGIPDEPGLHMVPDPALLDALRDDTRQVVAALGVLADRIRGDRRDKASSPPTGLNQLATERLERAPVGSSPGADVRLALRLAYTLNKAYELAGRTPDIHFGG